MKKFEELTFEEIKVLYEQSKEENLGRSGLSIYLSEKIIEGVFEYLKDFRKYQEETIHNLEKRVYAIGCLRDISISANNVSEFNESVEKIVKVKNELNEYREKWNL